MSGGPLEAYRARVADGGLDHDPAQGRAVEKLQRLHDALDGYRPAGAGRWLGRLGIARSMTEPPAGLYIHGDVGRGKSMLMDLFFERAPVANKRRVHFHEFMLEIQDRLHALRGETQNGRRVDDLLSEVALRIADDAWLLCFDEMHVVNIADAMILSRFFEALFDRGVVVVTTSNWPPARLYEGGLQRELFLPFIDLLTARLDVLELQAARDYRLARLARMAVYHTPLGPAAERQLDHAFEALTDDAVGEPASLTVKGRVVTVPAAARGVARFSFAELCEAPLGAGDYIALATAYRAVIVSGIPRLKPEQRNEAKRFGTLIDALYERKVKLVCSAETPPQDIYRAGEHAFEFRRTASRLMEMQSTAYLNGAEVEAA